MKKKVDQDQEADQWKNKNKRRKKIDYILFQNLMLFPITVRIIYIFHMSSVKQIK